MEGPPPTLILTVAIPAATRSLIRQPPPEAGLRDRVWSAPAWYCRSSQEAPPRVRNTRCARTHAPSLAAHRLAGLPRGGRRQREWSDRCSRAERPAQRTSPRARQLYAPRLVRRSTAHPRLRSRYHPARAAARTRV